MNDIYFIGVTGGSGSGKSTVARNVIETVGPEQVTYIQQDSYYKDLGHLPFEVRSQLNFDHPDAFDNQLFIQHLSALKKGETVEQPLYEFYPYRLQDRGTPQGHSCGRYFGSGRTGYS